MDIDFFVWTKYQGTEPTDIVHDLDDDNLKSWLSEFLDLSGGKPLRDYKFNSETGESCVAIKKIIHKKDMECVHILAKRLSLQEEYTSSKTPMVDILQGALVQVIIKTNDDIQYILAKIDYSGVINEDRKTVRGLPTLKKDLSYKICKVLATMDNSDVLIDRVLLGDSNTSVADFWKNGFLETTPINCDAVNSKNSFGEIEKFLKKEVYKNSPPDFNDMRNQLVAYMRRETTFSIDKLAQSMFVNFKPESSEINIEELQSKLLKLPETLNESRRFDKQFDIVQSEIKARIRKKYNLSDSIVLELKYDIQDLSHTIVRKINGTSKGIWIKTDIGYNEFPEEGNLPNENQEDNSGANREIQ